jgi:hypothetical protein
VTGWLTYEVTIAGIKLDVRCRGKSVPLEKTVPGGVSERLDLALAAIEAQGRRIRWVIPKYQAGMAVEVFRVVTDPAPPADPRGAEVSGGEDA